MIRPGVALSIVAGAVITALFVTSANATRLTKRNQRVHRPHPSGRVSPKARSAIKKSSKKQSVTPRPYLLNAIFLTDLRGTSPLAYLSPTSRSNTFGPPTPWQIPAAATKYPGVDLLITIVLEGKVALPPRAIRLISYLPKPEDTGPPKKVYMDHFQFSEDGTRLTGIAFHGDGLANEWQYQDLFVVDPNNGQARLLTQRRRLSPYSSEGSPQAWSPDGTQVASMDNFDIESRFPIQRRLLPPLWLGFPTSDIPTHYPEEGSRLILLDIATGAIQTLIQQSTEIIKSDPSDPTDGILRPWSNKRIAWAINNSGQRGVLFSYKTDRDKLFTNCFIPVPLPGTGQPGEPQFVAESDLPAYGIIRPTFSPAVVQAEAKRKYTLKEISPRGDRAIFYRDNSYTAGSGEPGPDGMTFTWDVYAGRWEVVTSSGKIRTNHDQNELEKPFTWTWDGQRPLFELERIREDVGRYNTFATLDLLSGKLQRMPIPDAVPTPRTSWHLLSPAQARRAAEYWRHAPAH